MARVQRGNEFKRRIAQYVICAYGSRGIAVYEEIPLGTSIIGKQRRIDLLVLEREPSLAGPVARGLALECKYQDSSGTADEKIPYALEDLAALSMPGAIVYAGSGFSEGVLHLLQASPRAAYCLPDDTGVPAPRRGGDPVDVGTWQLDHILAQTFGWWDVLVAGKRPMLVEPPGGGSTT